MGHFLALVVVCWSGSLLVVVWWCCLWCCVSGGGLLAVWLCVAVSVGLLVSVCRFVGLVVSGGLWWSLVVVRVVLCVCLWSVCVSCCLWCCLWCCLCVGLCVGLWCCVFVGLVWWSVCHAVNRAGSKKNYLTRKRRATK